MVPPMSVEIPIYLADRNTQEGLIPWAYYVYPYLDTLSLPLVNSYLVFWLQAK